MNFSPDTLRSRALRKALAYWRAKAAGRSMPARRDLDPTEMVAWLPHTLLVEVIYPPMEPQPQDFHFRLVGTDVVERYGREFTGQRLSSLDLDGKAVEIMNEYRRAVQQGSPQYFIDEYVQTSGRAMHYERLLMPLSDDGRRVNMLFGVQKSLFAEGSPTLALRS